MTAAGTGALIYDTDLSTLYYYNGTAWVTFSSVTNLALGAITDTTITVTNSAGTGIVIPSATAALSGLLPSASKVNYDANLALSGAVLGASNLATFTGTTIPDNSTIKSALQALETTTEAFAASKGVSNGLASLDATGKIPTTQLPALAITDVYVVATITARDALTAQTGDVAKVTDAGAGYPMTYIYDGTVWVDIQESSDVISVNGLTGVVSLTSVEVPYSSSEVPTAPTFGTSNVQSAITALDTAVSALNDKKSTAVVPFTTATWGTAQAGVYTITYSVEEHELNNLLTSVQVQEEVSTNVYTTIECGVEVNTAINTVKLTVNAVPDNRFAGRVIISQV